MRAESSVDATRKIKAVLHAGRHKDLLGENVDIIKRLANLGSLDIKESGAKEQNTLASVVKEVEIFLPLEGMIDPGKEKQRIGKEIENIKRYLHIIEKKLANENFAGKAPEEIIAKENNKRDELAVQLEKLEKQLDSIV